MAWWLLGCVAPPEGSGSAVCDPRELTPGEVRVKQVGCGSELIGGGEGRVGDWILENAVARFVIRGTYAPLTELEGDGGTLIDAAAPGGTDLLVEYLPDGDRSSLTPDQDGEAVVLVSPGVTWRLEPDVAALEVLGEGTGRLVPAPGVTRTGATLDDGGAFLGFDGEVVAESGTPELAGVGRVGLTPEATWPDGAAWTGTVDADQVAFERDGLARVRYPVVEGEVDGWAPPGSTPKGVRAGCTYEGTTPVGCASLLLRVQDQDGAELRAVVTDGAYSWTLPPGGGRVPAGTVARTLHVGAGPEFSVSTVAWAGVDDTAFVTLFRELSAEGWALVDVDVPGLPDPDTRLASWEALSERVAWGVDYAVVVADDEIPPLDIDDRDPILAAAGSRTGGGVWSWPWTPNGKRPAHGAVPWQGLGVLDQLAVSQGGESAARHTVVSWEWAGVALANSDPSAWTERPDFLWFADLNSTLNYWALLDGWVDVKPVSQFTWVRVDGVLNEPGIVAAMLEGRVSAGNGARLSVDVARTVEGFHQVTATVEAPHWMRFDEVSVTWRGDGARFIEYQPLNDGQARFYLPDDANWVLARAEGTGQQPWTDGTAWVTTAPVWLAGP